MARGHRSVWGARALTAALRGECVPSVRSPHMRAAARLRKSGSLSPGPHTPLHFAQRAHTRPTLRAAPAPWRVPSPRPAAQCPRLATLLP